MARKKRRRSDFKQLALVLEITRTLDMGKTIHYKFGADCTKFFDSFGPSNIGFSFTKGSKEDTYKHDRNVLF